MSKEYFSCKARYVKIDSGDGERKVSESWLVDAMSVTEAEAKVVEYLKDYVNGELLVDKCQRCVYTDVIGNDDDEMYFECKFYSIEFAENGKEKRTNFTALVKASDFHNAYKVFNDEMKNSMFDMHIDSLRNTSYLGIIE